MAGEHRYTANISWACSDAEAFAGNRYSRAHQWRFDGGAVVPASSSPLVVPAPMSDLAAVDPEEALVAALSSCHMLFFLAFAAKAKYVVERYEDEAVGVMGRNARNRMAMVQVTLRPRVGWQGEAPAADVLAQLHERAHEQCYIANSVSAEVVIEPR